VQAAVASSATSRVTVGTDIALAFPRSPTITAMTARDLAELSGGRFILGLGTQVKRVNEQRFGVAFEHPAPKIAEAVQAIRAALQIGFYATTRTYRPVLALHGFEELVEPLREAFGRGDFAALAHVALPMVDTFAVAGDPDECRERIAAFEGLADRVILGGAWV